MASFPTVDFSQYQWVVNDTNYLTKWNNFQTAINTLQANINKFGAEAKAEVDSAIGIAQSLIEAYNVNVLEPFKAKCTLGLDFAQGVYFVDDGTERVETTDFSTIGTASRSTTKKTILSQLKYKTTPTNQVARLWNPENGKCEGASVSPARTNKLLWSEDLSQSEWGKATSFAFSDTSIESPIDGVNFQRISENTDNSFRQVSQDVAVSTTNKVYTLSFILKNEVGNRNIGIRLSNTSWSNRINITFRPSDGEFLSAGSSGDASLVNYDAIRFPDGSYLMILTGIPDSSGSTTLRTTISLSDSSSSLPSYTGDGSSSMLVTGFQVVEGGVTDSYIKTEGVAVSTSRDDIYLDNGDVFNSSVGTFLFKIKSQSPSSEMFYGFFVGGSAGGTSTNSIVLWRPSGLSSRINVYNDGNLILSVSEGIPEDFSEGATILISYNSSDFVLSVNGNTSINPIENSFAFDRLRVLSTQAASYEGTCELVMHAPCFTGAAEADAITAGVWA